MATITTNAPKSGSSSSSAPTAIITVNSGRKPRRSVCLSGCCACRTSLAHRIARRVQDHRKLHEFGRLQVDEREREPPARPVDRLADAGDEHQQQQHGAADEEPRREVLPGLHRHWNATSATAIPLPDTTRAGSESTRRGSRCARTPPPLRSTPSTPSRGPRRTAGSPPTRATRRRRASSAVARSAPIDRVPSACPVRAPRRSPRCLYASTFSLSSAWTCSAKRVPRST